MLQDITSKGAVAIGSSDENGYFEITGEKTGSYEIQISSIGFESRITNPLNLVRNKATTLGNLVLTESTFALNEVAIEGKKAPIKRAIDRTIINIEVDATAPNRTVFLCFRLVGHVFLYENEPCTIRICP